MIGSFSNYEGNPILLPTSGFEAKAVYNPAVIIVDGVPSMNSGHRFWMLYRAGVALLDLEQPWKVIARTPQPILEPEEEYEREGDVPNVVFPEGAVIIGDELVVFYGGADKVCCAASVRLDELVNDLMAQRKGVG